MKQCETCKEIKDESEFYWHPSLKGNLNKHCKQCFNAKIKIIREIKKTAPPKPEHCECCGKPVESFHCDHDHQTGLFRGWLCSHCNQGIGQLGDNLSGVMKAVRYLSTSVCAV